MCCAPYDCHYAAYGGKRPRADMINGRVGSAFQDAGAQTAAYASDGESIVLLEDGSEVVVDESYEGEFVEQGDPEYMPSDDGSGTRNLSEDYTGEVTDGDSFASPLEEQNPPDLLPQENSNPLRTNEALQDPGTNSSNAPQRIQDALDTIDQLDNLQQPPPSGGESSESLNLDLQL